MRRVFLVIIIGAVLALSSACNAKQIDMDSLLEDMLDRSLIAEFPEAEFVCKQASSYDPLAKTPGNEDWFAPHDFSNFYGCDEMDCRKEWILMDVEGPGAIVRWWITQYKYDGIFRIYLDGADEPAFFGRGSELIGASRDSIYHYSIAGAPLSAIRSWGCNLYFPIPFAKHCKVTYDGPNERVTGKFEDNLFYQINYLQYPKGTDVKTITKKQTQADHGFVNRIQRGLLEPDKHKLSIERSVKGGKKVLKPGENIVRDITGVGAISSLRMKVTGDDLNQALRSTVISASFDGKERVWAPVGGFFGSGPKLNPFKGWWRQVEEDGWMNCWWPMPFKKKASVKVTNYGSSDVTVELADAGVAKWTWTDRTMYFNSSWRGAEQVPVTWKKPEVKEWNYLTVEGKGVFVGDTLALFNRPEMGGRVGPWWGEGDEKIFIDGESFPSHFGTGTEDYYGYAWGTGQTFGAPFHAMPCGDGNRGVGHTVNTRVRILDKIPFNSSFRFDLELIGWQETKNDYATTTHWYSLGDAKGNGYTSPEKVKGKVGVREVKAD